MRLYVTPASPWVRRSPGSDPRIGHHRPLRLRADPVAAQLGHPDLQDPRPRLRDGDARRTDSRTGHRYGHADRLPCYLRLPQCRVRRLSACWRAKAPRAGRLWPIIAIASGNLEAQIMRRAELLRSAQERSNDFIAKMRDRQLSLLSLPSRRSSVHLRRNPSIWPRSPPLSPAATTTGAMVPTGAAPHRSLRMVRFGRATALAQNHLSAARPRSHRRANGLDKQCEIRNIPLRGPGPRLT